MISVPLALALLAAAQEPLGGETKPPAKAKSGPEGLPRLFELVAKQEEGERFLKASASIDKVPKLGDGTVVRSTATLYLRAGGEEDGPRALLWEERETGADGKETEILTLLTEESCIILYPADQTALQYDLSKDGNLPWQRVFWHGVQPPLERDYKLTLEKDPLVKKEEAKNPDPEDPNALTPGNASEEGMVGGMREGVIEGGVFLLDPYSLHRFILDLDPRGSRQKSKTVFFMVFVDPESYRVDRIHFEDAAERLTVLLSDWTVVDDIPKSKFEFDLEQVKVRKR